MGEYAQPVTGMRSCFELSEDGRRQREWSGREWFVIKDAEMLLSADGVIIPRLAMGVEAREQVVNADGSFEDVRATKPNHPMVKYAHDFTHNFDLIAERKSAIYHLRELAKASVMAKFLLDSQVGLQDGWFELGSDSKVACGLLVPQTWNLQYRSHISVKDGKIVVPDEEGYHSVYGGVEFAVDRFDLTKLDSLLDNLMDRLPSMDRPGNMLKQRHAMSAGVPRGLLSSQVMKAGPRRTMQISMASLIGVGPESGRSVGSMLQASMAMRGVHAQMGAPPTPQGVDLNLDQCDLSEAKPQGDGSKVLEAFAVLGKAFWSSISSKTSKAFSGDDRKLLNDVFNPHLSDRREEGDSFVPPQTTPGYVERLRGLVKEEEAVREQRRLHFSAGRFAAGSPGPLFPSSWSSSLQAPCEDQGKELIARPDYLAESAKFEGALRSTAPSFDRSTEDGTRFRIYRFGSVEVRTTQDHDGRERAVAIFSVRASSKKAQAQRIAEQERVVKLTEYVERARQGGAAAARGASLTSLEHHSYVVLETENENLILTERLEDGSVTWEENPADLEDRNSIAKFIRSADVERGSTVGDARRYQAEEACRHPSSKGYAQGVHTHVCGGAAGAAVSGFRHHPTPRWSLSELEQETARFAAWTYDDTLEARKVQKEADRKERREVERRLKAEAELREKEEMELMAKMEEESKQREKIEQGVRDAAEQKALGEAVCLGGHVLISFKPMKGFPCDICEVDSEEGDVMWGCRARDARDNLLCSYDVCAACMEPRLRRNLKKVCTGV